MSNIIQVPYQSIDWIYEGDNEALFEYETGEVLNRAPKQVAANLEYLVNIVRDLRNTVSFLTMGTVNTFNPNIESGYTAGTIVYDPNSNTQMISKIDSNKEPLTNTSAWGVYEEPTVTLIPLSAPVVNSTILTAYVGDNIVLSLSNLDSNYSGVSWNISGNYTIVSGSLSGSSTSITIKGSSVGNISVSAKVVGDGTTYSDSSYSSSINISINEVVLPKLATPTITSVPTSGSTADNIIVSLTNVDSAYQSVSWSITGDYTLVSGNLSGSTGTSITIKGNSSGTINVSAYLVGDNINKVNSNSTNISTITVTQALSFNTSINGESVKTAEGITFTDVYDVGTLKFNSKTVDLSNPSLIMWASVNGVLVKLDFASEYTSDQFVIETNAGIYNGVFTQNSDYSSPIVLTQ
jgi:hypothetical protein